MSYITREHRNGLLQLDAEMKEVHQDLILRGYHVIFRVGFGHKTAAAHWKCIIGCTGFVSCREIVLITGTGDSPNAALFEAAAIMKLPNNLAI